MSKLLTGQTFEGLGPGDVRDHPGGGGGAVGTSRTSAVSDESGGVDEEGAERRSRGCKLAPGELSHRHEAEPGEEERLCEPIDGCLRVWAPGHDQVAAEAWC